MATLKQILANRINALKSTGPRTEAGKSRSRLNAMTHGLARLGPTAPELMGDLIADRREQWRSAYRPEGPAQEWVFERLCAESVRLDLCERGLIVARTEAAERAAEGWDEDRAAAVAERAAGLASRPEVIQARLSKTRHGVLWLIERWELLAGTLRREGVWTPSSWAEALDLLGVPIAARAGSGPWELGEGAADLASGLELAERSIAALRERLARLLDARDARARAEAEAGLGGDEAPAVRRFERYLADARRQVDRHRAELLRLQASSGGGDPSPPARQGPPAATAAESPRLRGSAPPNVPPGPPPAATSPAPEASTAPKGATPTASSAPRASLGGKSLAAGLRARLAPAPTAPIRRS